MDGNAGTVAVIVEPAVGVGNVAGDGRIIHIELGLAPLKGNSASAILIVAGAAGNQAALEDGAAVTFGLPKLFVIVEGSFVLGCLFGIRTCTIDGKRGALVDDDDILVARAVPIRACLTAVDHVAVEVDGVVPVGGNLYAVVTGIPIVQKVDNDIAALAFCAAEQAGNVVGEFHFFFGATSIRIGNCSRIGIGLSGTCERNAECKRA